MTMVVSSGDLAMTRLLEEAVLAAQKLSAAEQDALAALIMDEIRDEKQWEKTFANSQSQLSQLAQKARNDISSGRVSNKGIDEL